MLLVSAKSLCVALCKSLLLSQSFYLQRKGQLKLPEYTALNVDKSTSEEPANSAENAEEIEQIKGPP